MPLFRRHRKEVGEDAEKALKDASANLRRVKARSPEVSEVAKKLREMRERNHFAEQLQVIIDYGGLK